VPLVETRVLAAAGLAGGLLLATWGAGFLLGYFASTEQPLAIDNRRRCFGPGAIAAAAASLPALRAARAEPMTAQRQE
jgi:hypothetical protein